MAPGPELYGLLRHLSNNAPASGWRGPDVAISLFEPERERWKGVAEAVTEPLMRRDPWIAEQQQSGGIQITWSKDATPIPGLRLDGQYDFVLLQLVLNEVDLFWPNWLEGVMASNVAPGGMVCVIDMERAVHKELGRLGFGHAQSLNLHWSDAGPREMDPITSTALFSDDPGLIEKRNANAQVSFWERLAGSDRKPLPPRRADDRFVYPDRSRPPAGARLPGSPDG